MGLGNKPKSQEQINIDEHNILGAKDVIMRNQDGSYVDANYPFDTDGDSVYCKDIDKELSEINSFEGVVCDMFDDLHSVVEDSTTNNPKVILIHFNRTIFSNFIGIGCAHPGGDFSNLKVELLRSGSFVTTILDESLDNTKYTSKKVDILTPDGFNAMRLTFSTADPVCITNLTIQKAIQTTTRLQARSEFDNKVEDINSFRGALNITNSLIHRVGVATDFHMHTGTLSTLAAPVLIGDTSITLVDSTGFTPGEKIQITGVIALEDLFYTITDNTLNVLTLDMPIIEAFDTGTLVEEVTIEMNVLGTLLSPQKFVIEPPAGQIWQITRLSLVMTDGSDMDDARFGGRVALTNGLVIRRLDAGAVTSNQANYKTNGDLKQAFGKLDYSTKAPAGSFGLHALFQFTDGEFIFYLDGDNGDTIEFLVQDDLTLLQSLRIEVLGRIFGG